MRPTGAPPDDFAATSDLCDAYGDEVRVADPGLVHFGGRRRFGGPLSTLVVRGDVAALRQALHEPGAGRVLVVDNAGSSECAVLGDQLALLALQNGWAGVVVNGCVRDAEALADLHVGVMALGAHPRRCEKGGDGMREVPVVFAGLRFEPGCYAVADWDALVLVDFDPGSRSANTTGARE